MYIFFSEWESFGCFSFFLFSFFCGFFFFFLFFPFSLSVSAVGSCLLGSLPLGVLLRRLRLRAPLGSCWGRSLGSFSLWSRFGVLLGSVFVVFFSVVSLWGLAWVGLCGLCFGVLLCGLCSVVGLWGLAWASSWASSWACGLLLLWVLFFFRAFFCPLGFSRGACGLWFVWFF